MKIKINQKPIEIDAHLKYKCPKCDIAHWISIKEARTKNFKIVCDCDTVFSPQRIKKLKVVYTQPKSKLKHNSTTSIPDEMLAKCTSSLMNYGFTKTESERMLMEEYIKNPANNCLELIKNTLESLGANNNEQYSTNIV